MRFRSTRRPSPGATHDDAEVARLRRRYLDLMKGALTHTLYRPMDVRFENAGYVVGEEMRESVEKEFSKEDFDWVDVRADGRDWPRFAQSMIGLKRLDNVQECVERVLRPRPPRVRGRLVPGPAAAVRVGLPGRRGEPPARRRAARRPPQ
jgi:hypothetical protein